MCALAAISSQYWGQETSAEARGGGSVPAAAPSTQHFVCSSGYTPTQCHEQMVVLRKALAVYPLAQLGDWTWVLVHSENWNAIVAPRGLDPDSPAFTFTPKRQTFVEEALVISIPLRQKKLLLKWGLSRDRLLDFAIRHELGHAICNDPNEKHADHVAELLAKNKPLTCDSPVSAAQSVR